MGFFDKIKEKVDQIKEDNKYFKRTTARINNAKEYYGWVNYKTGKMDPNEDFRPGSYVSIEGGNGVIYNTSDEDYIFTGNDIASFTYIGDGHPVNRDKIKVPTLRFSTEFKDGKKTNIDIIHNKVESFKATFGL